jgi:hypothetical protein
MEKERNELWEKHTRLYERLESRLENDTEDLNELLEVERKLNLLEDK